MKWLSLLLLIAIVISVTTACGTSNDSIQTPTLTSTPVPTVTVTPTPTSTETATPVITSTPTPTITLTQTPTPVPTLTLTPTLAPTATPTPTVVNTTVPQKPAILEGMDFKAIDNRALTTPESVTGSVSSLASYLTQTAQNDIEKARAIYIWIANNISYDVQSYLNKNFSNLTASDVLRRRTAICEGYANLFNSLADAAGLESVMVGGWLKGIGYKVGQPLDAEPNHAWTAVKIAGKWYLIDSTLASGRINESMQFVKEFSDFYFFTPPEQFIYHHLPEEQKWQLLDTPISKAVFESMPDVTKTFFNNGLQLLSHKQCIINTGGDLSVTIGAPSDVLLSATLSRDEIKLSDSLIFVQRGEDSQYHIDVVFPAAGSYILEIFAKNKADTGSLWNALKYKVVATAGKSGSLGFPEILKAFLERDAYLLSPMTGHLAYGSVYDFKITVPDALDVAIIINDKWTHLDKQGQVFSCSYNIADRGELGIYASFPDSGLLYKGLLNYICE